MRRHIGKDGWGRDSYDIPQYAIIGSSDCGTWNDSPAPSDKVRAELIRFRKDLRRDLGIKCRFGKPTQSGNVFMGKQWIVVQGKDFQRAGAYALQWLIDHKRDTRYVHDADQAPLMLAPQD